MVARFKAWLASFSIASISLSCVWVALVVLFNENEAFHDYIFKIFNRQSEGLQAFIEGFAIPLAMVIGHKYRAKPPETP